MLNPDALIDDLLSQVTLSEDDAERLGHAVIAIEPDQLSQMLIAWYNAVEADHLANHPSCSMDPLQHRH